MESKGDEESVDCRSFGEKEATELLATQRPVARAEMAAREDRIQCVHLRPAYTVAIWREQKKHKHPLTPGCTWCGLPTGNWCEKCDIAEIRPMRAVCTRCEEIESMCRPCSER